MRPPSTSDGEKPARALAGIGRVLLWNGGSVWIGRNAGQGQWHSHHAIQVTLASTRPVHIRDGSDEAWHEASSAIVMPDRPHQFDGCGHAVAMVFVEPETLAGRALTSRYGLQDVWLLSDGCLDAHSAALHAVFDARGSDAALIAAAQRVVEHLSDTPFGNTAVDPRIANVLDCIRTRPGGEMSLAQAAAVAHLSPSRFRHLFVVQTGISFRAYLLWTRVGYAVARGMAGGSWTEAAQQAGFADSAHLSRTCRRMFGVAPTMLVREDQAFAKETAKRTRSGLAAA
ncbi:MAG TPA: AraC family transcriptional regulator [Rhodanobacter sp.]|nr:AraC family transcriptional regulator [Rhodanobacter sp.]